MEDDERLKQDGERRVKSKQILRRQNVQDLVTGGRQGVGGEVGRGS